MDSFAVDLRSENDLEIYRQIFINAHEGICVCQEGKVVFANPAFCAMTGYCAEELYSQSLLAIVHPEDHAHVISEYSKRMQGSPDGSRYEFRGITKSGDIRWLLMSAVLISWNGRPAALDFVSDVEDLRRARENEYQERIKAETLKAKIAERQRAEAEKDALESQLRQSRVFEAVGLLAGGVAHDFNNLLGGVMSCLYLARSKHGFGDAELIELDHARNLCVRGGELTRRLLDVTKRRPGNATPFSVQSLVEEIKVLLERTLPKQIRLSFRTDPDLPFVKIDRSTLTAALLNLASNALDAMPDGGELTVGIHREACESGPGNLIFEVSDTGVGMPPEIRERAFEPFFTTKAVGKGTGLGLAMVYALARDAGGAVKLVSSPGKGTTVMLVLPIFSGEAPGEEKHPPPEHHPLTRSHVLVVEDDEMISTFEEEVLKKAGYKVLKAGTKLAALEALRSHADDVGLIVLDLMMPEGGGEQLNRMLKRLRPEIPVLFATGRYDLAEAAEPAAVVVPKPFSEGELLDGVAAALHPGSAQTSRKPKSVNRNKK
jgi:PAS domain S-box-containing protein